MQLARILAVLAAAPWGTAQDSSTFESSDYGIRLKIPAKWNIDATRQARVILKLNLGTDSLVLKPELLVYEATFAEPMTSAQYKEQLRHYIQRAYKEPRMIEDRAVAAGGRSGFVLGVSSRGTNDAEIVSYKGLIDISPRRMLGVDGTFPKGQEQELVKVYDALLASVEFLNRRMPAGAEEGMKRFADAAVKAAKEPAASFGPDELGIFLGEKRVGSYTVSVQAASEGAGVAGVLVSASTRIDLGEDGKVETQVNGFLADDLSTQRVVQEEVKIGKDKRVQNFWAKVSLSGGSVTYERRVNGERSEGAFKTGDRAVLSELVETLQGRLVAGDKSLLMIPTVGAFDNEPGFVKIEIVGLNKMRTDSATQEVFVSFVQRDEGALITYWHDAQRRLVRVSHGNQSFVIRRVK